MAKRLEPTSKLPETEALVKKELVPTVRLPAVFNDPPVTELVVVSDLLMFNEPLKELEPAPRDIT